MVLNSHRWSEFKRGLASKVRVSEVGKPRNLARFGKCLSKFTGALGHISIYFVCILRVCFVDVAIHFPGQCSSSAWKYLARRLWLAQKQRFFAKVCLWFFQAKFIYFVIQRGCFCLTECWLSHRGRCGFILPPCWAPTVCIWDHVLRGFPCQVVRFYEAKIPHVSKRLCCCMDMDHFAYLSIVNGWLTLKDPFA